MKKLKFMAFTLLSVLAGAPTFASALNYQPATNSAPALNEQTLQREDVVMAEHSGWYYLTPEQEAYGVNNPHNTTHYANYAQATHGYNRAILRAMDKVMAIRPEGGGYYTGAHESPVGYDLQLNGYSLLTPLRDSSYCSGATYTVFIEALNQINPNYITSLNASQLDAIRLQRADGTPRPDNELLWGLWNNDYWGVYDALVSFADLGEVIKPYDARPGDFLKIQWTATTGHFVIFLGWIKGANGLPVGVRYWSSNTGTNGYGESEHSLSSIYALLPVRLTKPNNLLNLQANKVVTPLKLNQAGFVLK